MKILYVIKKMMHKQNENISKKENIKKNKTENLELKNIIIEVKKFSRRI